MTVEGRFYPPVVERSRDRWVVTVEGRFYPPVVERSRDRWVVPVDGRFYPLVVERSRDRWVVAVEGGFGVGCLAGVHPDDGLDLHPGVADPVVELGGGEGAKLLDLADGDGFVEEVGQVGVHVEHRLAGGRGGCAATVRRARRGVDESAEGFCFPGPEGSVVAGLRGLLGLLAGVLVEAGESEGVAGDVELAGPGVGGGGGGDPACFPGGDLEGLDHGVA
ncbi:hypothetical protein, partial [Nocardioides bigeumensis]|uniref:hypothetical protein n=1 Tax=Nocardioides bigeumensis TaxID=433657 RepID=UPI0031D86CCE